MPRWSSGRRGRSVGRLQMSCNLPRMLPLYLEATPMLRRPTAARCLPVRPDFPRPRVLARTLARALALAVVGWVGFGALAGLAPGRAWAMKNGIEASGCEGCHGGGKVPTVTLTGAPAGAAVGQP